MIAFGPFLTRFSGKSLTLPEIESTGYALEFSSAKEAATVPIYRRRGESLTQVSDYLFHQQDAPFPMKYWPYDSARTEAGLFVGLDSLIVALYRDREVARPLVDFLGELCAALPLEKAPMFPGRQPGSLLKPEVTGLGFYLLEVMSYGRTITVMVGWFCPQDRQRVESAPYFPAGAVMFRPRPDRTLNPGRWLEPRGGRLNSLLRGLLRKAFRGPPLDLLSEEGKRILLDKFKWTRLATMTNKEARQARVEFARSHPELLDKPAELGLAMRQAELYAPTTPVGYILKYMGSIISDARR